MHSWCAAAADTKSSALAGEEAQEKLARYIGACKLVVLDVSQNQLVSCCSKPYRRLLLRNNLDIW
jgi:hypothetical protein